MTRYCKHMDVTNPELIERAIRKCLVGKWNRNSVHCLLAKFSSMRPEEMEQAIRQGNRNVADEPIGLLSAALGRRIKEQKLTLPPIHCFTAKDRSSGKMREYCEESMVHQFCNYIAVEGLMPLFVAKIGAHQCASLVGRGQSYGQKIVNRWMRTDKNGTRVVIQADVRKAYPSTDKRRLKRMLQRDIKNEPLLWLVFLLLDVMPQGLSIGSYLSMFLCNYMLSYAWQAYQGHRESDNNPICHLLMYMDDLLLFGSNKRKMLKAFWSLCRFLRKKLGYRVKRSWRHFRAHYFDKNGKSRGCYVDCMGIRFYRDHCTLRRRIFLRARRTYEKLDRRTRAHRPISKKLAGRAVAYYGWLIHTDLRHWMKAHVYKHGLATRAKKTVSYYALKARECNAIAS